ncbi:MAG: choice-of-anchor K domain-containing protein [Cyanobacteria bacterium P01_D01_bin.105]
MLHSIRLARVAFAAVFFTTVLPSAGASAARLIVGESRATFGSPVIDPAVDSEATFQVENSPNADTETFVLGEPGPNSTPNRLSFSGQPFSSATQQPFSIGQLTYLNGQTFEGTHVSSVPLGISLNFSQPFQGQRNFGYDFTFDFTPNADPANSADNLFVSENPASQTLAIQEESFSLELLGFSDDDGNTFARSFQIPEDQSIRSELFARVKPVSVDVAFPIETPPDRPTEIPEPTILSGLLVLGIAMRLRRSVD